VPGDPNDPVEKAVRELKKLAASDGTTEKAATGEDQQDLKVSTPRPSEGQGAPVDSAHPKVPANYVVGPEDILDIDVFDMPELRKTVRVSNDGTIALPLLGFVKTAGLTVQQLRQQLEMEYGADYLEKPQVSVFVVEFHSQPVSVIGAVDKPGVYQVTGSRSLIEMLSLAGGVSSGRTPAGPTVLITRKGGFGDFPVVDGMRLVDPDKLEVSLRGLLYSHQGELNIDVKPFDTISVSTADIVYVVGEVHRPGGFVLENRDSVTVLQALAMAEGLSFGAKESKIEIIRDGPNGTKNRIPVDVRKIMKGKSEDLTLAKNDVLYVPRNNALKAAARMGEVAGPSAIGALIIYNHF